MLAGCRLPITAAPCCIPLIPCDMCSGTVLLYGIPKVVIGENQTFQGPEAYLQSGALN